MDDNDSTNNDSESFGVPLNIDDLSDSSDSEYISSDQTEEVVERMGNAALVAPEHRVARLSSIQLPPDPEPEPVASDDPPLAFDLDLPPEHLYLGDNMETLSGRVVLTEGSSFTLPLLPRSYGTLIPGQTFPLTVSDYPRTHMLRKCVETDHTFGCVATRYNNVGIKDELIGTTAEIFEFSDEMGHVCIKAKGRQRFRVLKAKRNDAGYFIGDVKILPEVKLSKPLTQLQNKTLNRFRTSQKERCKKRDALLTPWPSWVYDQYDTDKLVERVDKELTFLKQGLRQVNGRITMPQEPTELSFWIATHLDPDERHFVIRLNSPIQRLRWQLSLMSKCHTYVCGSCGSEIGHQSDVFAMSVEGAQNTYVNPHGFQHETITLTNATSLAIVSPPSNQFSWFPGYAWSIAVCESCRAHIGWQFSAQQSRLRPSKFWGLSRQSLKTKLSKEGRQECDIPVM